MKRIIWLILLFVPLMLLAQGKRPLVWVIDAGHGGHDTGTKTRHITEKEINLKVTQEVVRLLRKHKPGIKVITTRNRDMFVSLSQRCHIANRARADLFLSIHVNWTRAKHHRGTETFYAKNNLVIGRNRNAGKSELLARLLQNSYAASGRPIYRGVRTNRLYVTTHTNMPAALTEIAFISNKQDEVYITSEKGMKETARMIFNALMEYYSTTQARTHVKTLNTLRRTNDKKSGVKNSIRVAVKTGGATQSATSEAKAPQPSEAANKKSHIDPKETPQHSKPKPTDVIASQPTFSIQLFACTKKLKSTDKRLKGVKPVHFLPDGKVLKCLYGNYTDYRRCKTELKKIRKKFPDAFIVAQHEEKIISTSEALLIINKKKQ